MLEVYEQYSKARIKNYRWLLWRQTMQPRKQVAGLRCLTDGNYCYVKMVGWRLVNALVYGLQWFWINLDAVRGTAAWCQQCHAFRIALHVILIWSDKSENKKNNGKTVHHMCPERVPHVFRVSWWSPDSLSWAILSEHGGSVRSIYPRLQLIEEEPSQTDGLNKQLNYVELHFALELYSWAYSCRRIAFSSWWIAKWSIVRCRNRAVYKCDLFNHRVIISKVRLHMLKPFLGRDQVASDSWCGHICQELEATQNLKNMFPWFVVWLTCFEIYFP